MFAVLDPQMPTSNNLQTVLKYVREPLITYFSDGIYAYSSYFSSSLAFLFLAQCCPPHKCARYMHSLPFVFKLAWFNCHLHLLHVDTNSHWHKHQHELAIKCTVTDFSFRADCFCLFHCSSTRGGKKLFFQLRERSLFLWQLCECENHF